jgi:hypothetical protein
MGEMPGQDHPEKLNCVQYSGLVLHMINKADIKRPRKCLCGHVKDEKENLALTTYEDALYSAQWLGISLFQPDQYKEAKSILK